MAAAPEEVRQRLDRLDFGSSIESSGNGFHLKFNGGRFRSADQLDEAPVAPDADEMAPAGE